jgi:hypothetical protein
MVQGFDIREKVHFLDIDPIAHFDFNKAHDIEDPEGLPQGVPADMEVLGQAPLGREAVSRFVFLPKNECLNLIDRILIEPNPADRLQQKVLFHLQVFQRAEWTEGLR